MPLFRYSDPNGIEEPATLENFSDRIRFGDVTLTNSAQLGDPATSTIAIDDPAGELDLQGLRAFDVRELSAPSNNQVIGRFVIQNRRVKRNAERSAIVGTARHWEVELSDYNWHLGKRRFVDQDANRPAETIGARLNWLLRHAAHINLNDYGHVIYPSRQIEANDYRTQTPVDLLNDLVIEDNYNFWVDFNEAHGKPELFFINPLSSTYQSDIYISNDLDDVDHEQVFLPNREAELERSPSRIAFGALVTHPKGFAYARKDSTGQQFAKLDQVAPHANVKSQERAERLARKYVNDHDEETDSISVQIKVPRSKVNAVRHGQLIGVKFVHLPGYEDWVGMRVLQRTVMQELEAGDTHYLLDLMLVGPSGPIDTGGIGGPPVEVEFAGAKLMGANGGYNGGAPHPLWWAGNGDSAPVGYPGGPVLDTDLFSYAYDDEAQLIGFNVLVDIASVDLYMYAGFLTTMDNQSGTATMELHINGAAIDQDSKMYTAVGIEGWADTLEISVNGVALSAGDLISGTMEMTFTGIYRQWFITRPGLSDRLEVLADTILVSP